MKTQFIKVIFSLVIALNAIAQDNMSGVYMTYSDYENNKLTFGIDCKTQKHTIKLHEFLNKPYITINHNGKKFDLKKDSIYGIINCNEPLIRFQDRSHFTLAEKGAVWIFYEEVNVTEGKVAKLKKQYYFSTKGDGKLIELKINNIKAAFPNNTNLHDMIDAEVKNDQDILSYDSYYKMFRINHMINSADGKCVCPAHNDVFGTEGEKCSKCGKNLEKEKK